jgi:hypothetical protein
MTLLGLTAKKFAIKQAAREISKEIQKAGLDTLLTLGNAGVSIVSTYLKGCPPQKQALYRSDINNLLKMGITFEEVLDEVARQIPQLAPIIQQQEYKRQELQKITEFLAGG